MDEMTGRLRDVESVDPPDLWEAIERRAPSAGPEEGRRRPVGIVAIAAATVVALLLPLFLLSDGPIRTAGVGAPEGSRRIGVTVTSASMEPTLRVGDRVTVDLDAYREAGPARGDLIAFTAVDFPDLIFIKRVIGLPGEVLTQSDGTILVDGRPLHEPYARPDPRTLGPWVVREGHVFVAGDDRPNSNDSRWTMGQIPLRDVLGRVVPGEDAASGPHLPPGPAPAETNPDG